MADLNKVMEMLDPSSANDGVDENEELEVEGAGDGEELEEGAEGEESEGVEGAEGEESEQGEGAEGEEGEEGEAEYVEDDPDVIPAEMAEHPAVDALIKRDEEFRAFEDTLSNNRYEIPSLDELKLQLEDSNTLYDILTGQKPVDVLLETMRKAQPAEAFNRVMTDLVKYAAKQGFVEGVEEEEGAAAETPREKELRIENERLRNQGAQNKAAQTANTERLAVAKKFEERLDTLLKKKGIEADDEVRGVYAKEVAQKIAGNKAILARIKKGQFVDVDKLFVEAHKTITSLTKKVAAKAVATHQVRSKTLPKTPASTGGKSADSSAKVRKPGDAHARVSTVASML